MPILVRHAERGGPLRSGLARYLNSVQGRFLIVFVPLTVVLACGMIVAAEYANLRAERTALRAEMRSIAKSTAPALSDALWHLDARRARLILDTLLVQPEIVGVSLIDDYGQTIAIVGTLAAGQEEFKAGQGLSYNLLGKSAPIGTVTLHGSDAQLIARFEDRLWVIAIMGVGILVASILASLIANWRAIGRPMGLLLESITRFERERRPCDVAWDRNDEFAKLITVINRFQRSQHAHDQHQRALRSELEEEVANRTRALRDAARDAAAANQAKTNFLAMMSHELRTPLNAIIGFSEAMSGEYFGKMHNARYVDYAGKVHESGQMLLELINQILDVSRVEAGQFELARDAIDPGVLAMESLTLLRNAAKRNGLELNCMIPETLPRIVGDRGTLRRLLNNIIENAVKFTDRGGRIDVSVAAEGGGVVFRVADTGIGMAEQAMRDAFEPFTQAADALTRGHGGVGLGLYLAKQIADGHGGTLALDSRPGEGTTVTIWLPMADGEASRS